MQGFVGNYLQLSWPADFSNIHRSQSANCLKRWIDVSDFCAIFYTIYLFSNSPSRASNIE
jgi:hypothetical protein